MQGSSFEVKLKQAIVDPTPVGNVVISAGSGQRDRSSYKQSFEAPEADILIVEDNELNLKVETKLLTATKVNTDTANSGAECTPLQHERTESRLDAGERECAVCSGDCGRFCVRHDNLFRSSTMRSRLRSAAQRIISRVRLLIGTDGFSAYGQKRPMQEDLSVAT